MAPSCIAKAELTSLPGSWRARRVGRRRIDAAMFHGFLVAVAGTLEELSIRDESERDSHRPRLHEGLGVVDRNHHFHVADIQTSDPFSHSQGVAVRPPYPCVDPP